MKDMILSHLPPGHPWGQYLQFYPRIDSTNTEAKRQAAAGAPHGTVMIADSQTAGRGRLGRSFCSPAGSGIYMSVILRPNCLPVELMHLTCAAAVAICDAVESTLSFRPGIKWINDLLWQNKKLAGILTELSIDPKSGLVEYAIVGIGINCGQGLEDFPPELRSIACSAAMATGQTIDRGRLAAAMIRQLEQLSRELPQKSAIMERYRQDCVTIGKEVVILRGEETHSAHALSVNDDGSLLVAYSDGRTGCVSSGEVSVRGLCGYA